MIQKKEKQMPQINLEPKDILVGWRMDLFVFARNHESGRTCEKSRSLYLHIGAERIQFELLVEAYTDGERNLGRFYI